MGLTLTRNRSILELVGVGSVGHRGSFWHLLRKATLRAPHIQNPAMETQSIPHSPLWITYLRIVIKIHINHTIFSNFTNFTYIKNNQKNPNQDPPHQNHISIITTVNESGQFTLIPPLVPSPQHDNWNFHDHSTPHSLAPFSPYFSHCLSLSWIPQALPLFTKRIHGGLILTGWKNHLMPGPSSSPPSKIFSLRD